MEYDRVRKGSERAGKSRQKVYKIDQNGGAGVKQPDLPELPGEAEWCPQTQAWWKAVGRHPEAKSFTELDWLHLADGARLHHAAWAEGDMVRLRQLAAHMAEFQARMAGEAPESDGERGSVVDELERRRAARAAGADRS